MQQDHSHAYIVQGNSTAHKHWEAIKMHTRKREVQQGRTKGQTPMNMLCSTLFLLSLKPR